MKFKNVLILYKKSAYRIYFSDNKGPMRKTKTRILKKELQQFKMAHDHHYETLRKVSKILLTHGIRYKESFRGKGINYRNFDLIITVGGDGTFLEASRNIKNQVIFGVNSAPKYSVGRFCIAHSENFEKILKKIIRNQFNIVKLNRLQVKFSSGLKPVEVLNEILISHKNPAALSRYLLKIGGSKEAQRSSGLWVSTPAGSTGAIKSAGGKSIAQDAHLMQYKPRELYIGKRESYQLTGGMLSGRQSIDVTSLMRQGMVYVDGAHLKFPFGYGENIKITLSPHPIKTLKMQ